MLQGLLMLRLPRFFVNYYVMLETGEISGFR
jgi:hypothetical protein